jgi:hypothetical protein
MRKIRVAAVMTSFLLAVLALCPTPRLAQGLFGMIRGAVTNFSGAVVQGATVKVTNVNTNVVVTLTANAAGEYVATWCNYQYFNQQSNLAAWGTSILLSYRGRRQCIEGPAGRGVQGTLAR